MLSRLLWFTWMVRAETGLLPGQGEHSLLVEGSGNAEAVLEVQGTRHGVTVFL